jgi:uncharacterized protein YbjT (DUF2867 family)
MKRNALVIGATGATGRSLIDQLKEKEEYEFIYVVHYRATGLEDGLKVSEYVLDFENILDLRLEAIDDVFCCIGTTIKKAGSKEQFKKVDKDYVLAFGKWAKIQDVNSFHVISAMGSDINSSFFYNQVKGQMEEGLIDLNLRSLYIYRPSLLLANRNEFRLGEKIGEVLFTVFSPLMVGPLKKHKAVSVNKVAASMIYNALHNEAGVHVILSDEIQDINKKA